jgi:hypothetical protein
MSVALAGGQKQCARAPSSRLRSSGLNCTWATDLLFEVTDQVTTVMVGGGFYSVMGTFLPQPYRVSRQI